MADEKSGRIGKHYTITGRVQGVGFRPFVWRLAAAHHIAGTVCNSGGLVFITAEGTAEAIAAFEAALRDPASLPAAHIHHLSAAAVPPAGHAGFSIIAAAGTADTDSHPHSSHTITPDGALCDACRAELTAPGKRQGYAFNACTVCGPRFSMLGALPYDRANTAMADFPLCPSCLAEYESPVNRRFHAEAMGCPVCGPQLRWQDGNGKDADTALARCAAALRQGGIVLIKGIGGYHLACSPFCQDAVEALRRLKSREEKPFAVMFADAAQVSDFCTVQPQELALLTGSAAPIVLLPYRQNAAISARAFAPAVLRDNARCGCFLPYSPLHALLLAHISPLVMTSANPGGAPIMIDDDAALAFFRAHTGSIAGMLSHSRAILRPVEDSVVALLPDKTTQILRLSRGYAPAGFPLPSPTATPPFLAMGGDLKATFCLVQDGRAHISQYLGDLADADAFAAYTRQLADLSVLLGIAPRFAVCDAHPDYLSARHAHALGLPVRAVQHHHAHIASVMAEHGLTATLGAAFDGTGFGDDATVWGGEFLLCQYASFRRLAHLRPTRVVGGDYAARHTAQTAACFLLEADLPLPADLLPPAQADLLRAALTQQVGCTASSSMGRLFDAIAALLGLCAENQYEGQAAIALQQAAENAEADGISPRPMDFTLHWVDNSLLIEPKPILQAAALCPHDAASVGAFAWDFHHAVARMVLAVRQALCHSGAVAADLPMALSGGVFQNLLLLRLCCMLFDTHGIPCYTNAAVPPNDGGLALGQAYIAAHMPPEIKNGNGE